MLHHRTTDLATRAWTIAEREAEQVYRDTNGDYPAWSEHLLETYNQILIEFQPAKS
jgi:hypothetical protein